MIGLWLNVMPIQLVLYTGVSNATQENAATSSNSALHPTEFWMKTWQPFLSQTPEKEKAKEGETVVFGCQYHSPQGSSLNNFTVKWYKRDGKGQKDVMENNVTALENNTRIFMTGNLSEGDASLTILKVTASDHGTYYCQYYRHTLEMVTIRNIIWSNGLKNNISYDKSCIGCNLGIKRVILRAVSQQQMTLQTSKLLSNMKNHLWEFTTRI
ncbi:hypothetical protein L345_00808, partial [Ophiophagus hannah]